MTRLNILEYPDPRLRTRSSAVSHVDAATRQLIDDMLETMYAAGGIGLAAPQVNVARRVLVLDVSPEKRSPLALVNPEILSLGDPCMSEESCLSVPGVLEAVERSIRVKVRALDRQGQPLELDAEGTLAVCLQHEVDHLEGKLFVDRLSMLKRASVRWNAGRARKQREERA